jgi:hypothetical protein
MAQEVRSLLLRGTVLPEDVVDHILHIARESLRSPRLRLKAYLDVYNLNIMAPVIFDLDKMKMLDYGAATFGRVQCVGRDEFLSLVCQFERKAKRARLF